MCKSLKNVNFVCSFISFRNFILSKFYFIVNDLIRMFVEKSNLFDLQRHQMRSFFSRDFNKCNFTNKYDFIQNRITSYFYAIILFVFKSIKFETFESTHVREFISRQFSISSRSISFFFFSICFDAFSFFDNFSFVFCLQTLSKTFRHLLIYRLNHVKCFKN